MPPVTICIRNGDTKVIEFQGDGVLLATSTGSTGYSLSAGGPVVDPQMESILLTPLCPHTLTARSYIFRPDSALSVTVPSAEKDSVYYAVDGRSGQPLTPNDVLTVSKSPLKARFLHIKHREFYDVLRHKMGLEVTAKHMSTVIATNVRDEQNLAVRLIPLPIKNLVMKAIFDAVGEIKSCLSLSNLGQVQLPDVMKPYIQRMDFILGVQADAPYNCGVLSYDDTVYINFIRNIRQPELERHFHAVLRDMGLPVTVESNRN